MVTKKPKPKPSPIKVTPRHFGSAYSASTSIIIAGEEFALERARSLDPWEVFIEPAPEWPAELVHQDDRERFLSAWERGDWPVEMIDEVIAGGLGLIIGNDWGCSRAVVAVAFETDLAPRIALDFARNKLDPWTLPAHQIPPVLYGAITEHMSLEPKTKLDKMIREYSIAVTVRATNEDMQANLDEFDAFLEELGVDLTTSDEEE